MRLKSVFVQLLFLPLLHTLVEERVGERIPRKHSRIEPMNPCASFHLPLLHILVEERVGERRLSFDGRFMERRHFLGTPPPVSPPACPGEGIQIDTFLPKLCQKLICARVKK